VQGALAERVEHRRAEQAQGQVDAAGGPTLAHSLERPRRQQVERDSQAMGFITGTADAKDRTAN